uniref:Cytochrome b5 heme-binding domain-containing protein n=1 Tax=viral metagenome TaxID=1070528 RepID=A0A6C0L1J2_9ZZZZ|tara:strand:- start:2692 stop:4293 length:1602 start_codon:yes stop_codon:yes gene_type:complete
MSFLSNYNYDVIIVGGGITGLFLAYKLKETQFRILLIESSDNLGGRIQTLYEDKFHLESGAARFHGSHTKLLSLIHDLNLENDIVQLPQDVHYILRNKKSNYSYATQNKLDLYDLFQKCIKHRAKLDQSILEKISFFQYLTLLFDYETAQFMKDSFGYDSEFEKLNALSALDMFQDDFFQNNEYFTLQNGMSSIMAKLDTILDQHENIIIKKSCSLSEINDHQILTEDGSIFNFKQLIVTIPKEKLLQINYFNEKLLYHTVEAIPLLRIYFQYSPKNVWFRNIKRTITDNYTRHIIPINYQAGLIMISYTDGEKAKMLNDIHSNGDSFLIKVIHKEIQQLFGIQPPKPQFISVHYWKNGVHFWKNGSNMHDIYPQTLKPDNQEIYVCGESYSKKQGWIEGSLETAYDVIKKLHLPNFKVVSDPDDCDSVLTDDIIVSKSKLKEYTIDEVLQQKDWIILEVQGEQKIYDVSKWIPQHPGGSIIRKGILANVYYKTKEGESPTQLFKKYHSNWVIDKYLVHDNHLIIPKGVLISK